MQNTLKQEIAGFTAIEMIVVVLIISITSAIAIPSWLGFISQLRLNEAQDQIAEAMRTAQVNAKHQSTSWQACFHDDNTQVSWAVQSVLSNNTNCSQATNWQPLIDTNNSKFIAINKIKTTLTPVPTASGYFGVQFDSTGAFNMNANMGNAPQEITIYLGNQSSPQRCVFVQTLLGAIHTDRDSNC